jgi:hypothetical protein
VKLTIHLQLVPKSRKCGFTYPFPYTPSWHSQVKVKVKITLRLTASQSVSIGVESHLGVMIRYLLLFDNYGLVFVGHIISDERTGLSFVYAAGLSQRNLSGVRVPWDS